MKNNKYQEYKVIDFLKDDDFLKWNFFKNKEDNIYWEKLMIEHPDLNPLIEEAIFLYKTQIRFNDYSLEPEKIEVCHKIFQDNVIRHKKRKILLYWLSAAASIFLIFIVIQIYYHRDIEESGLMEFVKSNMIFANTFSKDIQLLVSTDQLVTIEEKEPTITYSPDSIKVTGKSVVKVNISDFSQLIVPKGKRSRLILSDGTILYVNSGTKVIYPNCFVEKQREIYVNGEIFLNVAPDPNKPFIIKTNEIEVRVLGTKFNIRAYEDDNETQVVLASGAVRITSGKDTSNVELIPSQMCQFKDGHISVTKVEVERYISWTHGVLYVDNERLDVLITRLSRYYGEEIICDEQIVNLRCSGKIDLKSDLEEVLDGLTFSFPIKIIRVNEGYRVKTK